MVKFINQKGESTFPLRYKYLSFHVLLIMNTTNPITTFIIVYTVSLLIAITTFIITFTICKIRTTIRHKKQPINAAKPGDVIYYQNNGEKCGVVFANETNTLYITDPFTKKDIALPKTLCYIKK